MGYVFGTIFIVIGMFLVVSFIRMLDIILFDEHFFDLLIARTEKWAKERFPIEK